MTSPTARSSCSTIRRARPRAWARRWLPSARRSPDTPTRFRARLAAAFLALAPFHAAAHTLKLATWNLDWLTDRPPGDPAIPPDVIRRSPADYRRLASYAARLDADIVALQEVDSPEAARRIFPPDRYRIILTDDPVPQRVGLAIRTSLAVEINPELRALDVSDPAAPHHLRGGLDVTLHDGATTLRLLVVHLKTGCWDNPPGDRGHSCPILRRQIAVLDDWILQRQDEGVPFALLGDFNRRLTVNDPFWREMTAEAPLDLVTSGYATPCWGGSYFIDHLLLGNAARAWRIPDSLRVMIYRDASSEDRAHLSDHCPVSIRLALPDTAKK
ncbi:endonuclease/exonuclease/phosphatase family protein [Acidomonas methanolica]|uniref:Endonuclease/exonuclease/phosphatase domain-containing protein n=1 Tax=Acidomonas methanolica NBRC 104435 TaxID=1231351 RepID=A0A023D935_ACIMT|nr:endonuclease/exonuclease/phosphatase family protein [Acidomonas methanolica]MBU2653855.1 endonuclease/exonuclease/phosphatase family protein [Acidomonas methanolica]GAJ30654.1 hypothetical protein Amme_212_037 [Acidomonas methanolica NBRC 104435]GBQ56034.1 hypothetical protein AA0498_2340 [Acidomonas methanolica]GEK98389.1 hydrolase [Acidomonas methanolica NBRC 104435]